MARFTFIFALMFASFSAQSALVLRSYNIRNFQSASATNLVLLESILKQNRSHLIAVQEIKNTALFKKFVETKLAKYSYKVALSQCGGSAGQRLGFIYDSKRLSLKSFDEDLSLSGTGVCRRGSRPAAIGVFSDNQMNIDFAAISLHLKAGGCSRCVQKRFIQLKKLSVITQDLRSQGLDRILIMGDLNTTNYNKPNSPFKKKFQNYVASENMKDSATQMKCSSYWGGSNRNDGIEEPSLLDHILISESFLADYKTAKVSQALHCRMNSCKRTASNKMGAAYREVSDHCPIGVHLR